VGGIALATSISYLMMLAMSFHSIGRQNIEIYWGRHLRWLVIVGTICSGAGWVILQVFPEQGSPWFVVLQGLLFFVLVYITVLFLPSPEVKLVRKYLARVIPGSEGNRAL
jgi:peptidoglycan biosynthesis protein MviN/MurJ (putative lipid II flippase)